MNSHFERGHVGLNVSNVEQSARFYRELFGFDLIGESKDQSKRFVFLGTGQDIILTLWEQSDVPFNKNTSGLHHLSFKVPSILEVQEFEQKLKTAGALIHYGGIVAHREGAQSGGLFFEDPDGIRLEVYAPMAKGEYTAAGDAPACGFF